MSIPKVMKAVITSVFGKAADSLEVISNKCIPVPKFDEVLIKVIATSINPIDVKMRAGYGKNIFTAKAALPWVLGRDFSGTVVSVGEQVQEFKSGDEVIGITSPFQSSTLANGAHAEYVCVPKTDITAKPKNINHVEAASLPYVALTTYTALITESRMEIDDYAGKHVFVQAGAGGVGSYAIQFLKALGANVSTTCSTRNTELVKSLGADTIIDYHTQDYSKILFGMDVVYDLLGKEHTPTSLATLKGAAISEENQKQVDVIYNNCLECLNLIKKDSEIPEYKAILKKFDEEIQQFLSKSPPAYVSIVGPLMPLIDIHGTQNGSKEYVAQVLQEKAKQAKLGRRFNFSVFQPNKKALDLLSEQISKCLIKATLRKTFPLTNIISAHKEIEEGHGYGKVVLTI